jgi:hypothetical protein
MLNRKVLLGFSCLLAVAALAFAVHARATAHLTHPPADAQAKASPRCSTAEYHQLDFWLGDWDAYDVSDQKTVAARLKVTPVVGGCALQEDYQQFDGMKGWSFSGYDAHAGGWHQNWVTNGGTWLFMNGKFQDGTMVLIATEHKASGDALMRSSWKAVDGNVREWADESTDNGATWTPMFDMIFKPHQAVNGQ